MKKSGDLVSIIVPVYNIEKYIEKCVKSLLSQSYENIEILLIDDGSKDSSGALCDKLEKEDGRVHAFHKPNGGLSDARNFGIKKAHGEYFLFIDGDDTISNNMVEILYQKMLKNKADIVACPFVYEYDDGSTKPYESMNRDSDFVMTNQEAIELMINKKYAFRHITCNKMYKSTLFNDVLFPVGKLYEDMGTVYKLIAKSKKIVYTYGTYYFYYQRSNSITKTYIFKNNEVDRIEMANDMYFDLIDIFPNLKDKLMSFRITQYIAVINVMIRSNTYDSQIIVDTRNLIKTNKKAIINYSSKKEQVQAFSLLISLQLYKIIFNIFNRGK